MVYDFNLIKILNTILLYFQQQLDADNNNAYYEFVVTARDKGITTASQSILIIPIYSTTKVPLMGKCSMNPH